jgi:hypothetical protein
MIAYIKESGELFTKNTTQNPATKIHSLVSHVEACLKKMAQLVFLLKIILKSFMHW